MNKLPVWGTVSRALAAPIAYFIPLAPVFLAICVVFTAFLFLLMPDTSLFGPVPNQQALEAMQKPGVVGSFVVLWLGMFVALAAFAVLVHRTIAGVTDRWRLGGRILPYIGFSIFIGLALAVVIMPIGLAGGRMMAQSQPGAFGPLAVLFGLVLLVFCFLGSRLLLALPATALRFPQPISSAWSMSKGNVLPLAGAWFLFLMLFMALEYAMGGITGLIAADGGAVGIAAVLVLTLLYAYYTTVVGIAFLTSAFMVLKDNLSSGDSGPEEMPQA